MIAAYEIGVKIAMANGVSSVLALIQKDVLGLKKAVDLTSGSFNRMRMAVVGAGAITFGVGMLYGLNALSKAGEKWQHELVQMRNVGMSFGEQQLAIAGAQQTASSVLTTTSAENLKNIRELRFALAGAYPDPASATREAIKLLPTVQKAQAVITSTLGESHGSDVYEMVKALELTGATMDEKRSKTLLEGMVRASVAQGGRLSAADWFQTLKYTRGAGRGYSDEFLQFYLPTVMQELKVGKGSGQGGGAGNPLASLYQTIVGGHISNVAAKEFEKLKLLDERFVTHTKTGAVKGVAPGGFKGSDVLQSNPYFYVRDFLLPALTKAGITDPAKQREEIAHLFGNRTSQQMVQLLGMVPRMEAERRQIEGVQRLDPAYNEAVRHDPALARMAVDKQWERLITAMGAPMAQARAEFFSKLAGALSRLAEVVERNPQMTLFILKLVGALSGFLVVAGAIAVGAAAIAALGGLGVVAVGAAIVGLGAAIAYVLSLVNWGDVRAWALGIREWATRLSSSVVGTIVGMWRSMVQAAHGAAQWVSQIVASFRQDMLKVWTAMTEALVNFVQRLRAFIGSLAGSLLGALKQGGQQELVPGAGPRAFPGFTPGAFHTAPAAPRSQSAAFQHDTPITLHNAIFMDGRAVANVVTHHQARAADRPRAGTTALDLRVSPIFPGSLVRV